MCNTFEVAEKNFGKEKNEQSRINVEVEKKFFINQKKIIF